MEFHSAFHPAGCPFSSEREDTLSVLPDRREISAFYDTIPVSPAAVPVISVSPGREGYLRNTPMSGSDLLAIVLFAVFLLVAFAYRGGHKHLFQMVRYLFGVKERSSIFVDSTVNESRLRFALLNQTFVTEGIILYCGLWTYVPGITHLSEGVALLCAVFLCVSLYFFQLAVYRLLGYVFADRTLTGIWIDSFVSIQSLLGIVLFPVALAVVYLPVPIGIGLRVAVFFYVSARIIFIYKSAKIFLRDIYGVLYFILYLCAMEIAPLFLWSKWAFVLYDFVELKMIWL